MTAPSSIGDIVRGLVLTAIDTCPDLRTRAQRVEIALKEGIITPAEAAEKVATIERMAA